MLDSFSVYRLIGSVRWQVEQLTSTILLQQAAHSATANPFRSIAYWPYSMTQGCLLQHHRQSMASLVPVQTMPHKIRAVDELSHVTEPHDVGYWAVYCQRGSRGALGGFSQ
jgi:hypothetical protein